MTGPFPIRQNYPQERKPEPIHKYWSFMLYKKIDNILPSIEPTICYSCLQEVFNIREEPKSSVPDATCAICKKFGKMFFFIQILLPFTNPED